MDSFFAFLSELPVALLYTVAGLVAALENIFPPFPSDVVVAFSVFAAARNGGLLWLAAAIVTIGSVFGAMIMYGVGRKFGSSYVIKKIERFGGSRAVDKFANLQHKYGLLAIFISRFLPGVRAVVPPLAGAMGIPAIPTLIAMFAASAIWYTTIAYVAFQTGSNWESILATIGRIGKGLGIGASAVVIGVILIVFIVKKFNRQRDSA